jgi:hypothetical protein
MGTGLSHGTGMPKSSAIPLKLAKWQKSSFLLPYISTLPNKNNNNYFKVA